MEQKTLMRQCVLGTQAGPQTIIVRQVVGEADTEKCLDIHIRVPQRKPAIEQIVDVFVKDLNITSVHVIPNKVVVRGFFEVKAIYVACIPQQSLHAVEVRRVRWTADLPIDGAFPGMDADAAADVESVDYYDHSRGYKHKHFDCEYEEQEYQGKHHYKHHYYDEDDDCDDYDDHHGHHGHYDHEPCHDDHHGHHDHEPCHDDHEPCEEHEHHGKGCKCPKCCPPCKHCFRHFDVSVVLFVNAKVMTDREVVIYPGAYPGLPTIPKG